jgi:hypothetical protein
LSAENFEQGRFARSIPTNERDLFALGNTEGQPLKEDPMGKGELQLVNTQ